ncbi:MAG: EipA family protein [Pseudomonadota bacterium]
MFTEFFKMLSVKSTFGCLALSSLLFVTPVSSQPTNQDSVVTDATTQAAAERNRTFSLDDINNRAQHFFGDTSGGFGRAVERVFSEQGEPVGYIEGSEWSAAIGGGLRYGRGTLIMKDGERRPVYWQGPSIGFDTGVNASKVFTLVYNLGNPDAIYRRYPGVEGAAFFVAGVSVTYQKAEGVTLAPIMTGVGVRLGANTGYTAYSRNRRINPF